MRGERCVAFFGDLFTTMVARVFLSCPQLRFGQSFGPTAESGAEASALRGGWSERTPCT